jgi:hypothetical protein
MIAAQSSGSIRVPRVLVNVPFASRTALLDNRFDGARRRCFHVRCIRPIAPKISKSNPQISLKSIAAIRAKSRVKSSKNPPFFSSPFYWKSLANHSTTTQKMPPQCTKNDAIYD